MDTLCSIHLRGMLVSDRFQCFRLLAFLCRCCWNTQQRPGSRRFNCQRRFLPSKDQLSNPPSASVGSWVQYHGQYDNYSIKDLQISQNQKYVRRVVLRGSTHNYKRVSDGGYGIKIGLEY